MNKIIMALKNGEVVGVQTDTVYGLIAMLGNEEKLNELKGRDPSKKYIYFISSIKQIKPKLNKFQKDQLEKNWPGNTTFIIEEQAYRIPDSIKLLKLLEEINEPVLSTSANKSGDNPVSSNGEFKQKFHNLLITDFQNETTGKPSKLIELNKTEIKTIRRK